MRPVIFCNPLKLPKLKHFVPLWKRHVEYPKFWPGDPQFRMLMCPFWMKMIHPGPHNPPEQVIFKVHPQMTSKDVKQYLEKLYDVPVMHVRTAMQYNDLPDYEKYEDPKRKFFEAALPYSVPPEDERYEKIAYVRLLPGNTFEYPDLFKEKVDTMSEDFAEDKKAIMKGKEKQRLTKDTPQLPPWFR